MLKCSSRNSQNCMHNFKKIAALHVDSVKARVLLGGRFAFRSFEHFACEHELFTLVLFSDRPSSKSSGAVA